MSAKLHLPGGSHSSVKFLFECLLCTSRYSSSVITQEDTIKALVIYQDRKLSDRYIITAMKKGSRNPLQEIWNLYYSLSRHLFLDLNLRERTDSHKLYCKASWQKQNFIKIYLDLSCNCWQFILINNCAKCQLCQRFRKTRLQHIEQVLLHGTWETVESL